jgi:peptidoglycan/LPS O-acetylase OafA/YrhL
MPGAILALLVVALFGGAIGDDSQLERLIGDGVAALFYLSNWRFIGLGTEYADLFASPSLVQHFWSLSIEEQFYLTYPILLIAALRLRGRPALGGVLGLAALASTLWMASLFEPGQSTSRLYFGTDTRLAEILIGALFAVCHCGRAPLRGRAQQVAISLGVLGVAGTFIYWFSISYATPWLWQGGFAGYAALTVAAIAGCVQPTGPARALLSAEPLPWLGKISYGVYLYHFPVYVTITGQLTGLSPWPLFGLRIGLTFALAIVSYYYIERPVRLGYRLRRNAFWVAIPAGMATTVVALLVAGTDANIEGDSSDEPMEAINRPIDSKELRVLIVGDSVAGRLKRSFTRMQSDFEIVTNMSAGKGCGFVKAYRLRSWEGVKIVDRTARCSRLRERWNATIAQFEPSVVLLIEGWPGLGEKFIGGRWRSSCDPEFLQALSADLTEAVRILGAKGARVALATTPPASIKDMQRTSDFDDDNSEMDTRTRNSSSCQNAVRRTVAQNTGSAVIDLAARICPRGDCIREEQGVTLRSDGMHYSRDGADIAAHWLLAEIASLHDVP